MANAASRSSANTDLYVGTLKCSIGLFGTQAKPGKEQKFDSAGPNGGALKYEQRGAVAPVSEATDLDETMDVQADPLAGDPDKIATDFGTPAAAAVTSPLDEWDAQKAAGLVDGEFRQVLVEDGTGVEVRPEDVRKGIRLEDGRFVDCTAQLTAITERTKLERIDIVATIDTTRVGRTRVVSSYFIGVQDEKDIEGAARLRLLYEGLRLRREAAVVKYAARSRQQLGAILASPATGSLLLLTLVFEEDFREPPARAKLIQKAAVSEQQVAAMGALLGALHDTPDVMNTLRDDAIAMREELRVRALAGEMDAGVVEPLPEPDEFDLEASLEASLAAVSAGGKA